MYNLKLIAAVSANMCIGNSEGYLPWHYAEDLKRFKELTINNTVIMGANTFRNDLKGEPLKDRKNIILTKKKTWEYQENCFFVYDVNTAFLIVDSLNSKTNWVIGGSSIYSLFEKYVDEMHITHIPEIFNGEKYFNLDWSKWKKTQNEYVGSLTFSTYFRKS